MMIPESIRMAQRRTDLSQKEAREVMLGILAGTWSSSQIAAWLSAMSAKGETLPELLGCHEALMSKCVTTGCGAVGTDVYGIVGEVSGTFDATMAAAIVLCAAGVPVAKTGSHSSRTRCIGEDLLAAVGVRTSLSPREVPAWLDEAHFAFLSTPAYHPVLSRLAPLRQELGNPTLLDLLWPLCHPANVKQHIIGVAAAEFLPVYIKLLPALGISRAILLSGRDGLGHLSPAAPTDVCHIIEGKVRRYVVDPASLGRRHDGLHDIHRLHGGRDGSDRENAAILRGILRGVREPLRDLCLLQTAPALLLSGHVRSLREGIDAAADLIDMGAAARKLDHLLARSFQLRQLAS